MMPSKNYPPASIAAMIKKCEAAGQAAKGAAIMTQWNKTCDKYPVVHTSWGAAHNIGTRSVKKNVFGGLELEQWLGGNVVAMPKKTAAKKTAAKKTKKAA